MDEKASDFDKKELDKLFSNLHGQQLDLEIVKSAFLDHDTIAVLVADDDGNYLFVNQAASKLFGYSMKEFMFMNIRDIRIVDGGNPMKKYKNFINEGSSSGVLYFFDKSNQLKVGLYRAKRVSEDINLSMMFDMTDQYNLFDDIIDQFNEQSDVLSNLPSISFRYNHRTNGSSMFTFVSDNISKLLRLTNHTSPTEWALGDLVLEDDLPGFMQSTQEAIAEVRPFIYRARLRMGDGTVSEFEVRSYPVRRSNEIVFYGTLYLL